MTTDTQYDPHSTHLTHLRDIYRKTFRDLCELDGRDYLLAEYAHAECRHGSPDPELLTASDYIQMILLHESGWKRTGTE